METMMKCVKNFLRFASPVRSAHNKQSGFTLIELLVVIAIIGLLSSVVMTTLNNTKESAMYAVAKEELNLIADALMLAGNPSERAINITGFICSGCRCRETYDPTLINIQNVPDSSDCIVRWSQALSNIADKSIVINENNYQLLIRDPWGAPYLMDENELERPPPEECHWDHIRTVGSDGVRSTSDDYVIRLPFRTPVCKGRTIPST